MEIFELSRKFPKSEIYSMTDQIRRSSRSVCANLAEAFRKRRYPKYFVAKLVDVEGEAAETQVWLNFCVDCGYMSADQASPLYESYLSIIKMAVTMSRQTKYWSV